MADWTCARCGSTGTGRQHRRHNRSEICQGCAALLAASGLTWCRRCHQARTDRAASQTMCKVCDAARKRAAYAANPEPLRERARAWRRANLEQVRARDRAYHWLHRPRLLAEMRMRKARRLLKILRAA